jgi:hypothetical protein
MKSRLIWRESWNNNDKDSFWIECTDQEVIDHILPLKSDPDFLEKIKKNNDPCRINENENEKTLCNFFLVSTDLEDIQSFRWVYPYSGLWNGYNPFEDIDLIDIDNLEHLKDIFDEIKKIK